MFGGLIREPLPANADVRAPVTMRKIGFVMELTLGSITHYLNLRQAETASEIVVPHWLPIEYQPSRVPWAIAGSMDARRALVPALDELDGVFMHTSTIALLCRDLFGRKPTVLSCDGTHLQKRGMRAAYGLKPEKGLAASAKHYFHRASFSPAAGFVAWSNWTRGSLIEDYGFHPDDVAVIPPGVNLDWFTAGERSHDLPRILFVGGDFHRKGGDVLLDVFRKRLRGRAELVLVTREPVSEEPGVTVHHDVVANSDRLRTLYATCDIFALPTSADCYSLVCIEALASGLPTVTTRVGGIPDIVIEGETGFLADVGDAGRVGDALELLVGDPARRAKMSAACRVDAARRFEARTNARRLFEFVHSKCG